MPEELSGTFDPEVDLNDDAVGTVEKNPNKDSPTPSHMNIAHTQNSDEGHIGKYSKSYY